MYGLYAIFLTAWQVKHSTYWVACGADAGFSDLHETWLRKNTKINYIKIIGKLKVEGSIAFRLADHIVKIPALIVACRLRDPRAQEFL